MHRTRINRARAIDRFWKSMTKSNKIVPNNNYIPDAILLHQGSAEIIDDNTAVPFDGEESSELLPHAREHNENYLLDETYPGYPIRIGTVEHKPSLFNRLFTKRNKIVPEFQSPEYLGKSIGGKKRRKTRRKYSKRYQ